MYPLAKFLVGLAVMTLTAVLLGTIYRPAVVAEAPERSAPAAPLPVSVPVRETPALPSPDAVPVVVPPLPVNAASVPDDTLLKLSALVDLPNAADRPVDKARWTQAVPIAEQLAQGPCDCEQRNWLNHFVAMGNAAVSGEDFEYYRMAGLMITMARNDKQLADAPVKR